MTLESIPIAVETSSVQIGNNTVFTSTDNGCQESDDSAYQQELVKACSFYQSVDNDSTSGTIVPNNFQQPPSTPPQYTPKKYHILDLVMFENNDIHQPTSESDIEYVIPDFVSVSFNLDFGNLRIQLSSILPDSYVDNVIFKRNFKQLTSCTIYPTYMSQILCNPCNSDVIVTCKDQLYGQEQKQWERELSQLTIVDKPIESELEIFVHDKIHKTNLYYKFKDWQYTEFKRCLSFGVSEGRVLRGQLLIAT